MKKASLGVLCALGILFVGCDLDIPVSDVKDGLTTDKMCVMTGGEYVSVTKDGESEMYCKCGGTVCGKNVFCGTNDLGNYTCGGLAYTILPSGPCMMEGIEVCANRITSTGTSVGYFVKCQGNRWTTEEICPNGYSCKVYQFGSNSMGSSICGECTDDNMTCVLGHKAQN